ncbi:MAG: hypothetical protein IPO17_02650 [Flavobacteriales bacterium]|nr:hypothetical protein [Flavobacteriales bacterium]
MKTTSILDNAGARLVASAILGLVMCCAATAQGLNNQWQGGFEHISGPPFGGSDIEFASGSAVIVSAPDRVIDLKHTSANITDTAGELLFFTNGVVVGQADGDTKRSPIWSESK